MTPRQALKLMDQARRNRIKDAIYATYNSVGGDVWGEKTPSDAIFVDVMCDHIRNFREGTKCTNEDVDIFWALSARQRRILCLEVGP